MLRRLLRLLGWSRPKPSEPDMTNVVHLGEERINRYGVVFPGFMSEKDVREAAQRRAEDTWA